MYKMFSSKWVFVLWFLQSVSHLTYGQPNIKFFRKDYKFIEGTNSFYKIHTVHRTWQEAKERCEMEGATLFYAINEEEANFILDHWNMTQPQFGWVYVGISTPNVKEVFETVDGSAIAGVYDRWGPGEPNNAGGIEECVVMRKDGTLNDDSCQKKHPFICKKTLDNLKWNLLCDIPDTGYEFAEKVGRCYKFHRTPMNWTDAYTVCNVEQSYLAIINTQAEADHLVQLTNKAQTAQVAGNFMRGAVHLGFQNKNGWKTIKGMPLADSGYAKWGNGQPDGGDNERCGSMFYNGKLNDIGCNQKCFFICEREVELLQHAWDLRFGEK